MDSENGRLGDAEQAALTAFADGSLAPLDRARVAERIQRSPGLRELVEQQRSAIVAVALLDAPAPPWLHIAVAQLVPTGPLPLPSSRPARRRRWPQLSLAAGFTTALAAVALALVVLPGSDDATVGDTVELSERGPSAPAPPVDPDDHALLATSIARVAFPHYSR